MSKIKQNIHNALQKDKKLHGVKRGQHNPLLNKTSPILPNEYTKHCLLSDGWTENNKIPFTFLTGDVNYHHYGGSWISQLLHSGDFYFKYIVSFVNMLDSCNEPQVRMMLYVVSPSQMNEKDMLSCLDSYGYNEETELSYNDYCEVINGAMGGVLMWDDMISIDPDKEDETGTESIEAFYILEEMLLSELKQTSMFFGFKMDQPKNAIGATGWDFIKGDICPDRLLRS